MKNKVFCNIWPNNALRLWHTQCLLYLSLNKALYLCDKGANQRSMHFPLGRRRVTLWKQRGTAFPGFPSQPALRVFVRVFVFAFATLWKQLARVLRSLILHHNELFVRNLFVAMQEVGGQMFKQRRIPPHRHQSPSHWSFASRWVDNSCQTSRARNLVWNRITKYS